MDFGALPPEINSGRMYMGAGPGSMLAAAAAWDALAAEMHRTAASYASTIQGVTVGSWQGPAATSMLAAAAPFVAWLTATGTQAEQTAAQAKLATAAYETAFAATVPPPVIETNRTLLMALIATNLLGQNTAAIAATEAQYVEMWAQDAAAMYGYAAGSAAASELTPFTSPRSVGTAAAQGSSTADRSLQALYTALDPSSLFYLDVTVFDEIRVVGTAIGCTAKLDLTACGVIGAEDKLGMLKALTAETAVVAPAPQASASVVRAGTALGQVTATLSRAGTVGSMSVPASWAGPSSAPSRGALPSFAGTAEPAGSGLGVPGVPGLRASRASIVVPRYGRRLRVMWPSPAVG